MESRYLQFEMYIHVTEICVTRKLIDTKTSTSRCPVQTGICLLGDGLPLGQHCHTLQIPHLLLSKPKGLYI